MKTFKSIREIKEEYNIGYVKAKRLIKNGFIKFHKKPKLYIVL